MTKNAQDERLIHLVRIMTLEEKLGQLTMVAADHAVTGPTLSPDYLNMIAAGKAGSVLNLWGGEAVRTSQRAAIEGTRLGIPLLVGFDVVHGHRTIFPVPLAEAGAFDPGLWERTAAAAAEEAASDGVALVFAPMLDIARDPRWGRVVETSGEDPVLASCFAAAKVAGFQGTNLADPHRVAATAKHFVGYGAVEGGREYASVELSDRALHDVHLPPFRAALSAGVATIMPAFNDLGGVPLTAHRPLLRDLLRQRWGFEGVIVSDYAAVTELIAHGVAADTVEAAALALDAGVDIDMMGDAYRLGLPEALNRGLVTEAQIDEAVLRVLRLKMQLGLFDDPHARGGVALDPVRQTAIRDLACEAAVQSFVLLRNENAVLPLAPTVTRIALLGPLADAPNEMPGPWGAAADRQRSVSYLSGLRAGLAGVEIMGPDDWMAADVIVLCLGETADMSGEAASRADPTLPPDQIRLAEEVLHGGKPVILVLETGRPLVLGDVADRVAALLVVWHPGSEAGRALARVLSGESEPGGRLTMTWPAAVGQIPVYFGQRPTGRPAASDVFYSAKYRDAPIGPRFYFGAGRGYGQIRWHGVSAMSTDATGESIVEVALDLENMSARETVETVFLFARCPKPGVAQPLLELRRFERVSFAPAERKTLRLTLPIRDIMFPIIEKSINDLLKSCRITLFAGRSADPNGLFRVSIC